MIKNFDYKNLIDDFARKKVLKILFVRNGSLFRALILNFVIDLQMPEDCQWIS